MNRQAFWILAGLIAPLVLMAIYYGWQSHRREQEFLKMMAEPWSGPVQRPTEKWLPE